jgi:phosphoenolpyruvate carboxykinase (GTP)
LCDGSEEEYDYLVQHMIRLGTLIPVNPKIRPNSYIARSDVGDGK